MDGEGSVNLIAYMEENNIKEEIMLQMWEAYIIEVGKRNESKK